MKLEFKHLSEIDCSEYVALNTNPLVRRQMPLTSDDFDISHERLIMPLMQFIQYFLQGSCAGLSHVGLKWHNPN